VQIEELGRQASLDLVARVRFGRLACAKASQPYIVPFYYVWDEGHIYSFTTVGQKIEWMRDNPLVCVEVDDVKSSQQWSSVVVFGRYEELPNSAEWQTTRERVHHLLMQREIWWEPGFAKSIAHGATRPLIPVFYRILIEQITGHRALPDAQAAERDVLPKASWLKTLLSRL
jgi:uncharacterized protein